MATTAETKPKPTTPWKPAQVLQSTQRSGFRRRWTHTDKIEKRLQEGWIFVESKSNTVAPQFTLLDGTQFTNIVRKRNLVLMEIPEETALQIEEYYRNIGDQNLSAEINEFKAIAPGAFGGITTENKEE